MRTNKFCLIALTTIISTSALAQKKQFQVNTLSHGTLTNGLVAYYKLEDTKEFYYGINNLANNGDVAFSAGKVNNGANLAKTTKWLSTGSTLGYDGTQSFAVSFWFKIPTGKGSVQNRLITTGPVGWGNAQNQSGNFMWAVCVSAENKIDFWSEDNNTAGYPEFIGTTTLLENTWYHCVVNYVSGSPTNVYINGASDASGTFTGAGSAPTVVTNIGGCWTGSAVEGKSDAVIDEVGFWNRNLSTDEISDIYNSTKGQTMCTVGVDCPIHKAIFFGTGF